MTQVPNDPNSSPHDVLVHDELRELQLNFAKHLNTRLKDGDVSHQELAVIRATLRDNLMVLRGPPAELEKERLARQAAGLPEFDDDDDYEY